MKNNKKLAVAILSIASIMSLAACGNGGASSVSSSFESSSEPESSSVEVIKTYAVSFSGANAKAFGLPATEVKEGDVVTFTVVAADGYILESVTSADATITGSAADGYSFVMPGKAVAIAATTVKEDEQFSLAFTGENLSVFGLPEKAIEGQAIKFFVNPKAGYAVKSVAIEGVTLNGSVSEGFNFVMPKKNVTINAVAEAIPEALDIAFEGTNAYAVNLPAQAQAGKEISFRIAAASGYSVTEVAAEGADGALIKLNGSLEAGYTFTMPNQAVKITANALGAYFKASFNSANTEDTFVFKAADANASAKYYSTFIKGFVSDGKVYSGNEVFARAGSDVYVLVDNISIASGVKVLVNNVEAEKENYEVKNAEGEVTDTYNAYKFTMPTKNVELKVTAEGETEYTVKANSADYFTAKTYKLVDDEPVYTSVFKGGEYAFVEFALKPEFEENYIFSGVTVSYSSYSSYSMKTNQLNNIATKVSDGVYKYQVSTFTNYASDLTFNIAYKEAKYGGKEFIGTFKGANFYGATKPYSLSTDITFDGAGAGKIGYTSVEIKDGTLDETAKTFKVGPGGTSTQERPVYYDGRIILTPYGWNESYSDIYVGVKGISSISDVDVKYNSDYSMNTLAYVCFYAKGTDNLIANFIKINNKVYLNVEIEFLGDSTEVKASASFKVKKNGVVVEEMNVPTEGGDTGGETESTLPIVGTWKSGNNTLTFAADGNGTFNNTYSTFNFTYTYNASTKVATLSAFGAWDGDNTATYKEATDTIVLDIDDAYYENNYKATFTRQA